MFEDFRKQNNDSSFADEAEQHELFEEDLQQGRLLFGMTSVQRFVVALMLMAMIIVLGVLFLLVTSKIVPPFLG